MSVLRIWTGDLATRLHEASSGSILLVAIDHPIEAGIEILIPGNQICARFRADPGG
jgi:hypothetical protein